MHFGTGVWEQAHRLPGNGKGKGFEIIKVKEQLGWGVLQGYTHTNCFDMPFATRIIKYQFFSLMRSAYSI